MRKMAGAFAAVTFTSDNILDASPLGVRKSVDSDSDDGNVAFDTEEAEELLKRELKENTFYAYNGRLWAPIDADAAVREHGKRYSSSFCGMLPDHPLRSAAILLASDKRIEHFILGVILFNCAFLLLEPPIIEAGTAEERTESFLDHT